MPDYVTLARRQRALIRGIDAPPFGQVFGPMLERYRELRKQGIPKAMAADAAYRITDEIEKERPAPPPAPAVAAPQAAPTTTATDDGTQ